MRKMIRKRLYILLGVIGIFSTALRADKYVGRVVSTTGEPISYATVYPMDDPVLGTATNNDGWYEFECNLLPTSRVIISFIGYEKQNLPLAALVDTATIVLKEQPIALEQLVVEAKPSKQRNKRKQLALLLHEVYVQMDKDFPKTNAEYRIVSDVRMDSENEPWGMEQMIARVVTLPEQARNGKDSTQMAAEYCKRYFKQEIRQRADTIYAGETLERMDKNMRKMATAVDSGVVVHQALFAFGNVRSVFEDCLNDIKHWSVGNESEGETVLSHIEKRNFLGIVKYSLIYNFIIDSQTLSIKRFSAKGEVYVNIPFGVKLNQDQLQLLNLLNMSEQQIEKFRLRKADAHMQINTIYQLQNGHLYVLEKNLNANATLRGTKKMDIPLKIRATQRVTKLKTDDVKPLKAHEITKRIKRQIVEIY